VLVFFCYPGREESTRLLAQYHAEDTAEKAGATKIA
jgi:hypothetical protein